MPDEADIAVDAIPPQESGVLVAEEGPLPEGDATLGAPVYLVECSPSHLALHARWYAPFLFLAPVGALCLIFLASTSVFVWVMFALPGKWQRALQLMHAAVPVLVLFGASALLMAAFVVFSWKFIKHRGAAGPIHFDRDANQLRFGRLSTQQTRPLSTVAALQLMPTTWLALLEKEASLETGAPRPTPRLVRALQRAFPPRENWHSRLSDRLWTWWHARCVVHQLNLVFDDGARLHLTDWKNRPAIQALAQRLAEFLNVPLTSQGTAEPGAAADGGGR